MPYIKKFGTEVGPWPSANESQRLELLVFHYLLKIPDGKIKIML